MTTTTHTKKKKTGQCQCGEADGNGKCAYRGPLVTVEYMPMWLRASHEAAGNRGEWPHNGALRLDVAPDCAARISDADDE
jgi:hypothetical protein